jgi:iron(III) transport system substrate-binding protein
VGKLICKPRRCSTLAFGLFLLCAAPAPAAESWKAEWEKTLAAAKKEGQVNVYHFAGSSGLLLESGIFQKRFPEIKVVAVTGDPLPRIRAERRAEKYLADVTIGGSSSTWQLATAGFLDPIRDALILPEVVDESRWWRGRHHYTDKDRRYAFTFVGNTDFGSIAYNEKLVNPAEFRSLWDFTQPKWKGKIVARDIRSPGPGTVSIRIFYYNPKLGPEYIRRLFGETEVVLTRDRRQGVDWLASGKYAICFFCPSGDIQRARSQGLPVEYFGPMKEGAGITSSGGNMGLLNKAPHPNAAKVFINWALSREAQNALQTDYAAKQGGFWNSLRMDIPKDVVPPESRLKEGNDYVEVDVPERMTLEPILKVFNEAVSRERR